jgi:hypothetical protein
MQAIAETLDCSECRNYIHEMVPHLRCQPPASLLEQ